MTKEHFSASNSTSSSQQLLSPVQDWDDLDAEDADDPSMVTEYVNDIFAYLYDLEVLLLIILEKFFLIFIE